MYSTFTVFGWPDGAELDCINRPNVRQTFISDFICFNLPYRIRQYKLLISFKFHYPIHGFMITGKRQR